MPSAWAFRNSDHVGPERLGAGPRPGRTDLLILDELAYVPLTQAGAELLFQILDKRTESSSIALTTNLPFGGADQGVPRAPPCARRWSTSSPSPPTESWRFRQAVERRKGAKTPGWHRFWQGQDPTPSLNGAHRASQSLVFGPVPRTTNQAGVGPDQIITLGPRGVVILKRPMSLAERPVR